MKKLNSLLIFCTVFLFLINISFSSACIVDQYVFSATGESHVTPAPDSPELPGCTNTGKSTYSADMKFVRDDILGWGGKGTETIELGDGSCVTIYHRLMCKNNLCFYEDEIVQDEPSPFFRLGSDFFGYWLINFAKPYVNASSYSSYTNPCGTITTGHGEGDVTFSNGESRGYTWHYTLTNGFCCDSNGDCDMDSSVYTCMDDLDCGSCVIAPPITILKPGESPFTYPGVTTCRTCMGQCPLSNAELLKRYNDAIDPEKLCWGNALKKPAGSVCPYSCSGGVVA